MNVIREPFLIGNSTCLEHVPAMMRAGPASWLQSSRTRHAHILVQLRSEATFLLLPSRQSIPLAIAIVQEGGEASPVGRPDFKSEKGPLSGPWWVRLPLSSATTLFLGDRQPSKIE